MTEKFSLKDHLFNKERVTYLADLIAAAHPSFNKTAFIKDTVQKFPELELKQRIRWIRDCLKQYLPEDYPKALTILLNSLPPELDPKKTDDDFGDFIIAPIGDFVAKYGCTKDHLDISLSALKEITKRFSMEDAIRCFLKDYPNQTLKYIKKWSKDSNYHVRRLTSEGTRPSLPWSPKVHLDKEEIIDDVLSNLYHDNTRYVVRSVANHLNDIAKTNPDLVIQTLKQWKQEGKQKEKELTFLIRHSLRTLIKQGHPDALALLGFSSNPDITVTNLSITNKEIHIGDAVEFTFDILANKDENLLIDYQLHFQTKKGELKPKVFKIKSVNIKKGETITITKRHPLRIMTTKRLYPGEHKIILQINGQGFLGQSFQLLV